MPTCALALLCARSRLAPKRLACGRSFAGQGNAEALYHLGMIYHLGLEGARDPHARSTIQPSLRPATRSAPTSRRYAGSGGDGLARRALALRYKLVAAEAGYALAQSEVARIMPIAATRTAPFDWYEAAARQGDWTALFMAFFQVMPEGPQPNRPRAWLYFEVVDRTLAGIPASDMPEGELGRCGRGSPTMRPAVEAGLSAADRAEAKGCSLHGGSSATPSRSAPISGSTPRGGWSGFPTDKSARTAHNAAVRAAAPAPLHGDGL